MRRAILLVTVMVTAVLVAFSGVALAQSTTPGGRTASDGGQAAAEKKAGAHVPDRYIVVLKDNENAPAVAEEHRRTRGAEVTHVYEHALRGYAARIPSNRLAEVEADSRVQFVDQDRTAVAFGQTMPTGINRVDGELSSTQAGNGSGSVNVGVAVLDTGINKTHPDLYVAGGRNFATWGSPNDSYEDGHGHGTHVAGTVGARDNDVGPVGVAPGVPLYGVKVLSNSGSGYTSWIIKGIDWVTANGPGTSRNIKVANMSLGGSGSDDGKSCSATSDAYKKAICKSTAAGVTYVVAAGNSNADLKGFQPAAYDEVLTVTALADFDGLSGSQFTGTGCRSDKDETAADFSNWTTVGSSDEGHTIAAPGVCIYSTWKSGGNNTISGTSMASPHVAGLAALCIGSGRCSDTNIDGKVSPSEVIAKLRGDAQNKTGSDKMVSNYYGFADDPNSPNGTRYYGYLGFAGGY